MPQSAPPDAPSPEARPWEDTLALGTLLLLGNLLTAPQDLGWLASNPSPWIALPLLIGLRHGFRCGFAAGAATSALILLSLLLTQPPAAAAAQLLFFLALPALGLAAAETQERSAASLADLQLRLALRDQAPTQLAPAPPPPRAEPARAEPAHAAPDPDHAAQAQLLAQRAQQLAAAEQRLAEQTRQLASRDQLLADRDRQLRAREAALPLPAAPRPPRPPRENTREARPPRPSPPLLPPTQPTAALDTPLRQLFEPGGGPIFPHLLRLLGETTGVSDAALYQIDGDTLSRTALLGSDAALPASLPLANAEIAHLAVTRQALVSCRQVWSSVPAQPSPWLAALPWPSPSGPARHLLLIHQLPFYLVHPLTFSRIQMICRWTAQFMNWRGLHGTDSPTAGPLLVSPALLRQATTDAAAMHREHGLPSASLSFRLAPGFTEEQAARLTLLVSPQLRATDLAAPHPDGSLDVLLTFDGPTEALRFQQRILALAARDPLLQGCLDLGTTFAPPERAAA